MKSGDQTLVLTAKGTEELRNHAFQLDVSARNILSLIEQGCKTSDAVLQRSMFPHNTVVDSLRRLLTNKFVAFAEDESASRAGAPSPGRPGRRDLRLNFGISPSQARFALSNFCMDEFGTEGKFLVDALSLCTDIMSLQEVLNSVRSEVDERLPARMPALIACVRELNDTDEVAVTGSHVATESAAPKIPTVQKIPTAKPPTLKVVAPAPAKPPAGALKASAVEAADPMRLDPEISLSQARFMLSEFCLNQFGVQSQEFVDAVNRCGDVAALQKVVSLIRTEMLNRHRDRLPLLVACVREINETAL
jgi:hypothetical protein